MTKYASNITVVTFYHGHCRLTQFITVHHICHRESFITWRSLPQFSSTYSQLI